MFTPGADITLATAAVTLQSGLRAINDGQVEFDFAPVLTVDSAALAVLLAWRRAASAAGKQLNFNHLPANLQSLAALYGVADLLQLPTPPALARSH